MRKEIRQISHKWRGVGGSIKKKGRKKVRQAHKQRGVHGGCERAEIEEVVPNPGRESQSGIRRHGNGGSLGRRNLGKRSHVRAKGLKGDVNDELGKEDGLEKAVEMQWRWELGLLRKNKGPVQVGKKMKRKNGGKRKRLFRQHRRAHGSGERGQDNRKR